MHPADELRVVSYSDAALDWNAMAAKFGGESSNRVDVVRRYATTRDPKLVVAKPGEKLTWFVLQRIDADVLERVMAGESEYQRNSRAFQEAVIRVEDLVSNIDARLIPELRATGRRQVGPLEIPRMSDEDMRLIAPEYRQEIGGVALARSFLAPKTGAYYPLQSTFQLTLMAKMQSVVAEAVGTARTLDGELRLEEASTDRSSDTATDVTATGTATGSRGTQSTGAGARGRRRKRPSKGSKR